MKKSKLSDSEWVYLIGRLKKTPGIRMGCEATCRRFVEVWRSSYFGHINKWIELPIYARKHWVTSCPV